MHFRFCEVTGELLLDIGGEAFPLFGGLIPFIGWKWVGCNRDGSASEVWPPLFKCVKFGVMLFGQGIFWTPPNPNIVAVATTVRP